MNLILLRKEETERPLPPYDPRAVHLHHVMRIQDGQTILMGVVNQTMGRAQVSIRADKSLDFQLLEVLSPPPPLPLTLIIGTPRPPTARRLLRDLASLGVSRIIWTASELNEKSYLASNLWKGAEWEWELMLGAMQGKTSRLPEIVCNERFHRLPDLLPDTEARYLLETEGSPFPHEKAPAMVAAIGPERGWTLNERKAFDRWGFRSVSLGPYTLRTETAATGAAVLYSRNFFSGDLNP